MTLASRIAVMHQGQVQQFDQPQTVYDRPANMFVAGFMGSPSMNFLPAQLVDDGGRTAIVIRTAAGGSEKLPLHNGAAAQAPGKDVIFGIRPEHLFRYDAELKARKPALASVDAVVELVEPTGAETMAVLRLGETEVIGRFESDGAPRTGEQLKLGIDMSHACLFEPDTQRLI
jgi:multiple sugar transport system ATP-binding protein